jgi:hypothetical protein
LGVADRHYAIGRGLTRGMVVARFDMETRGVEVGGFNVDIERDSEGKNRKRAEWINKRK